MRTRFSSRFSARFAWLVRMLILLSLLGAVPAAPDLHAGGPVVIYVDAHAPGVNAGTSWYNAYFNLYQALDVATPGTQIWVADYPYYGPTQRTDPGDARSATFALKNGVALYGGFAGGETSLDQRDPQAHPAVLDGQFGSSPDDAVYHVVTASGTDASAVLDGFVIRGGYANGAAASPCQAQCGGGIYMLDGSPTLRNLTVSSNRAVYGGGVFSEGGSPTLASITLEQNSVSGWGGGMHSFNSRPTFSDVTFRQNRVVLDGYGAGLSLYGGSVAGLTRVTFAANQGADKGGGLFSQESTAVLDQVTFSGNQADQGGGMENIGATPP